MPFHELYIRGTDANLQHFKENVGTNLSQNWDFREDEYLNFHYLIFEYQGQDYPHVSVWITRKPSEPNCYYVANIVPMDEDVHQITQKQYNDILDFFRRDVIEAYQNANPQNEINLGE
jgi:hypothetical protein